MADTELMFVSGKGGTGKSAITAAIAIAAARQGRTVLAVDMGTSLGLGAHLRHSDLPYVPVETRPGLWAMSMDRATALDEYIKLQLHVPQGAPTKQFAGALTVLAETAPGVREIISIGKPLYEVWKGVWDLVIVDGQSLGQFQSYLRAPATIAELVPTGNVRRQAQKLATTLNDPAITTITLVTNPAELPVRETIETLEFLRSEALCPPPNVIMNRFLAPIGMSPDDINHMPEGSAKEAAQMQLIMEMGQERWAREIDAPVSLPFLRGVLTPGEVAVQLADALGGRP